MLHAAKATPPALDALVITADEPLCLRLEGILQGLGHRALSVGTMQQASEVMKAAFFPLLIVERNLADGDALDLCRDYRRLHSDRGVSIVLLSDSSSFAPAMDVDDCIDRASSEMELRARLGRRMAFEMLQESFDNAAIGKALVSPAGEFLRVNQALCDMVGYTQDELLRTTFQSLTYEEDLAGDLGLMRNVLDGSLRRYELEKRYVHRDGHVVWALLSVSIVRDEAGAPLCFLSEVQDITARKCNSSSPRVSIVFGSVRGA